MFIVGAPRSGTTFLGRCLASLPDFSCHIEPTATKAAARIGAALITLYYEELVRTPETVLQTICRFLELPYEEEMLAFHERELDTVNVEREPWKEETTHPIDPEGADQWRQELSLRMIAQIVAKAWPEMGEWGYMRETPWVRLTPTMLSTSVRKIGWKLRLIFEQMRERE